MCDRKLPGLNLYQRASRKCLTLNKNGTLSYTHTRDSVYSITNKRGFTLNRIMSCRVYMILCARAVHIPCLYTDVFINYMNTVFDDNI